MAFNENKFSENDGWCTPAEVLDPIYEHFGGIGLDPFASPDGIVKADVYGVLPGRGEAIQAAHPEASVVVSDAIKLNWTAWVDDKPVYANGPFSICKDWVPKVYEEAQRGVESISLLPVRTGSLYWQTYISRTDVLLF